MASLHLLLFLGCFALCSQSYQMRHSLVRRASLYRMSAASDGDSSIRSSMLVDPLTDVSEDELAPENIVKIVTLEATDSECNALVWKCLGYALDPETGKYNNDKVFPKWREKYPEPPDLIGLTRNYDPSVDRVVRNASMNLMRSIPRDFKGGVRNLEAYGFKGFKLKELTPNKTRRAQLVNWLIFYKEKLFKKSLEELKAEKEREAAVAPEIAELPSERNYQKLRLDGE